MSSPGEEWIGRDETMNREEERSLLFAALASFYHYGTAYSTTAHLRRKAFFALPISHWELLKSPPISYLDTLNTIDAAIEQNSKLASAIVQRGTEAFGIPQDCTECYGTASTSDVMTAISTIRQIYRDWSSEGSVEREASLRPIMNDLKNEFSDPVGIKVLVPGAGLARLVFELCQMGFDTQGNEKNFSQLLASNYILNHCPSAGAHSIHPWVHNFSNHLNRSHQLQAMAVPDIHPASLSLTKGVGRMSISASDFSLLYGNEDSKESFDAVASVFFLDTAPNPIRYIEAIRNCLKKGGIWTNLGPLQWHFENKYPGSDGGVTLGNDSADPGSFELTNEEVMKLVEAMGFKIESSEIRDNVRYGQPPESMTQHAYKVSHWVARKI